jgi:hypothetical protein
VLVQYIIPTELSETYPKTAGSHVEIVKLVMIEVLIIFVDASNNCLLLRLCEGTRRVLVQKCSSIPYSSFHYDRLAALVSNFVLDGCVFRVGGKNL